MTAVGGLTSSRLLANYTFAFHDQEEVGPGLLAQIAKNSGLKPEDL
jgi:predicted RNA binding protein YcfA (HicA-like mRNA interferase family)